jgi:hypothetical protein
MKKVLFLTAVIASLSFAACNNSKTSSDATLDSLSTPVDSIKVDSIKVDTVKVAVDTANAGC